MAKTTKNGKPPTDAPAQTGETGTEGAPATETNPPAAPPAPETGSEQVEAPAAQAGAAVPSPEPEGSAPPPSTEPVHPAGGLSDEQRASLAALADTTQEVLEKQAEVKQPAEPLLDRVLRRLAGSMHQPFGEKHASTSPPTRLHGATVELNTRLYEAMVAEGVLAHGLGDTLQFLLEQLAESLRGGF